MDHFVENTINEAGEQENIAFGNAICVYLDELESLRLVPHFFFEVIQEKNEIFSFKILGCGLLFELRQKY